jgi:quercetin dioxygenase-like cupin family protein
MPIEIERFDAEHAVPLADGDTSGVRHVPFAEVGGVRVATLYFEAKAEIGRRELPCPVLLMVLEGGGTVRLGGEIREIVAGDAVPLPANNMHMIWTTGTPMTALLVEYPEE